MINTKAKNCLFCTQIYAGRSASNALLCLLWKCLKCYTKSRKCLKWDFSVYIVGRNVVSWKFFCHALNFPYLVSGWIWNLQQSMDDYKLMWNCLMNFSILFNFPQINEISNWATKWLQKIVIMSPVLFLIYFLCFMLCFLVQFLILPHIVK